MLLSMLSLFFHASQKELKMTKFFRKFLEMQNKKIDLIKDDITAKLFEELIRSKWEIEVMGENPHFGHLILGEDQLPNLERKCRLCM